MTNYLEEIGLLGSFLKLELKKELELQGHVVTGDLLRSIEVEVEKKVGGTDLVGSMLSYGIDLNYGLSPADVKKIPLGRRIGGLKGWIKLRGLLSGASDREITSFAFAITKTHEKVGFPSPAAARFSRTGKNTEFMDDVFEREKNEIRGSIADAINRAFDSILD
jgi:hypothetical protein